MFTSTTSEDEKFLYKALEKGEGDLKILYVTPEKISKSKKFMSKFEKCHNAGRHSLIGHLMFAKEICERGISADYYHVDMDANACEKVHMQWGNNKLQVIVDTVEFNEEGKVLGVPLEGETDRCRKVVCDPSYLTKKVGKVGKVASAIAIMSTQSQTPMILT